MNDNNVSGEKTGDDLNCALLLIDVISDFEFEDGEELYTHALPMARRLAKFRKKAKKAKIPLIYINDNFGKWQEDFKQMVQYCLKNKVRGTEIVKLLKPDDDDFYVLKPKHSAFFSTTLDVLLKSLNIKTLILTGVSTDICILFTANDAYMRDYRLCIAEDCVAAVKPEENVRALEYIKRVLKAEICTSDKIKFKDID